MKRINFKKISLRKLNLTEKEIEYIFKGSFIAALFFIGYAIMYTNRYVEYHGNYMGMAYYDRWTNTVRFNDGIGTIYKYTPKIHNEDKDKKNTKKK